MKALVKEITRLAIILIFFFAGKNAKAQTSTSTGTDFWLGFTYTFQPGETSSEYKVWISSVAGASGTVSVPKGAWSSPFNVAANSTTVISIPYAKVQNETSESIQPKGIHVISNGPVSVVGSMYSIVRPEVSLIMATPALGSEYYVQSYPGFWYGQSNFQIVATQNGTAIQITPTCKTEGNKPAGTPFTITLDSGEVYMVKAKDGFTNPGSDDLTGTHIVGTDPCKKFAVFGGAAEAYVPTACGTADPLFEELQPVATWGKEYIVPPFYTQTGSQVRIVASQNNTSVIVDGGPPIILNAGQFNEQSFNGNAHCITADKPIEVAQFMKGNTCNGGSSFSGSKGDPCMLVLNSNDQLIKTATFRGFNQPVAPQHLVNLVMKTAFTSQLKLNGAAVNPTWTAVPNCAGYSFATLLPANITNGTTHTITADSGFVGYCYGYGSGDASYGFPLGYGIATKLPTITGAPLTICNGTSTTLTASGGGTYLWSPGGATTSSITVSPATTTTYTVTVSGSCSSGSTTAVVTVNTCGINIVATNASMCRGECRIVTATAGAGTSPYTYTWSPGGANSSAFNACPTATTTYTVTATDATGKTATAISIVTINPTPSADFTTSPSGTASPNTPVSFTDISTNGGNPLWNFGDPASGAGNSSNLGSPVHTYPNSGDYCITLISTNSNSCADTITKCMKIIGDPLIWIPNVFTPNGDGINDVFFFYTEGVKELTCTIYDRWGVKMSEWNTVSGGWDGKSLSGNTASDGVYYYVMTATPTNETKELIKQQGFLQLLNQR